MTTVTKFTTPAAAGAEVHARAERHMSAKGGAYQEAVHAVLAADKQLAEAYAQPATRVATTATKSTVPVAAPLVLAQGKTPGETVHLRTVALMGLVPHLDYQSAVNQVLAADPDLKAAYARS
jgi:predicted component of type VI protein secretion system